MEKPVKKFYWTVFFIILLLSAYPIIMGAKIVVLYIRNGIIRPEDYANYVIPYSALCTSVIVILMLYPLLSKLKRFSAMAAAVLGSGLFLALELYMENITINSPEAQSTLQWQLFSCIGTPAAMRAFLKFYDNTFKIHYFLISFVIMILITSIVYNYKNAVISNNRERKNMLRFQMACTALFIAFSIFANITAFFREATDYLSPLSSVLTGSYFILLGVTFGSFVGGLFTGRKSIAFIGLSAAAAILTTSVMYYGEYRMLDGVLYRFGYSEFFQPLPYAVIAPVDLLVILASGALTALVAGLIRFCSKRSENKHNKYIECKSMQQ